jgi:hypothetical protein
MSGLSRPHGARVGAPVTAAPRRRRPVPRPQATHEPAAYYWSSGGIPVEEQVAARVATHFGPPSRLR